MPFGTATADPASIEVLPMHHLTGILLALAMTHAATGSALAGASGQPAAHAIADRLGDGVQIDPQSGEVRFSGKSYRGYYRAYACPDFAAARAVVRSIPPSDDRPETRARQIAAMQAAMRRRGCTPAKGRFRITLTGDDVRINHGYEAEENWVAAAALNIRGRALGLIIDASPYGPAQ